MVKLIFMSIIASIAIGCKDNMQKQNYFIPKNFEGNIAIVYSNSNADKQDVYEFTIPENGLLNVPYQFSEGNYVKNFYQKNLSNKYDTLFEELPSVKIDTSKNRIYFNRILTFEKAGNEPIIVETFYVGKTKTEEVAKDRFLFEKKLEEIVLEKKW